MNKRTTCQCPHCGATRDEDREMVLRFLRDYEACKRNGTYEQHAERLSVMHAVISELLKGGDRG